MAIMIRIKMMINDNMNNASKDNDAMIMMMMTKTRIMKDNNIIHKVLQQHSKGKNKKERKKEEKKNSSTIHKYEKQPIHGPFSSHAIIVSNTSKLSVYVSLVYFLIHMSQRLHTVP